MKTKNLFLLPALIAGLGLILLADRVTAQTFTTLHSFTALMPYSTNLDGVRHKNTDGAYPYDGLVLSGDTLYGMANGGGSANAGTVFAINTDGTGFTTLHSFAGYPNDGQSPYAGLLLSGSTLYGNTILGGNPGWGTVFAISTNGTGFTVLHSFPSAYGSPNFTNSDGAVPYGYGGLVISDNTLYGTANGGGSQGYGTIFKVNTDGAGFTVLHSFTAGSGAYPTVTNSDGANPLAGLILSDNTLYGTARTGGSSGAGTVFKVYTDGTSFTTLHNFNYSDGAGPSDRLILSGNTLYGAARGGRSGNGTLFKVNTDATGFTNLYDFTAGSGAYPHITNSDGAGPTGLILSGNTLYGAATIGGSSGNGTVFQVNVDGTGFTTLYNFTGGSGDITNSDGAFPNALILSGKTLYGAATYGGSSGIGTVFKLLVNGAPSSVANVAPVFATPQSGTNLFILSQNNAYAAVVLDGSQSSDADNDPLQFSWHADGQTQALATGALATNQFAIGPHTVQLAVSDGHDTATAQVSFEAITPATAVGQLLLVVDEANLGSRNKQPLFATLSATMSSFDRGDFNAALNQLSAFRNKVRAQVAPWNPALANEFTGTSQKISNVVSGRESK